MSDLKDLIAERDKFLKENPDLKPMQDEINNMMSTTLDPMQRLDILFMLISGKLKDLEELWGTICVVTEAAKKNLNDVTS